MTHIHIGSLVTASYLVIVVLICYASCGGIIPFLLALHSIQIRYDENTDSVSLKALDASAMSTSGFGLWAVTPFLLLWGIKSVMIGSAIMLFIWFGFRLHIRATPRGTQVVRRLAFFIPWSKHTYVEPPHAFVDGWGDFADPMTININFCDSSSKLELAWINKGSYNLSNDLVAEFNRAVAVVLRTSSQK